MIKVIISLYLLNPPSPPGWGFGGSAKYFTELHDADHVDEPSVVADHILANHRIVTPGHSAKNKSQFRRVVSVLPRPQICSHD
jgi:hypothetical protein